MSCDKMKTYIYVYAYTCMHVVCLRMFVLYYYNKQQSLVINPSIYKHYYQLKAERQLKKHETTWSHFYQKSCTWGQQCEPHKGIF